MVIQSRGRINTGVVTESVVTTPASPTASPYNRRVMPTPIAKKPLIMITKMSFRINAVFERKRGFRMKPTKIIQRTAVATLVADAVTGSTPSAMIGRTIIAPAACPNAAGNPRAIP